MFFSQNLKKKVSEKREAGEEKREKTTDCKEVTILIHNTEYTISSSVLKSLQKYQS